MQALIVAAGRGTRLGRLTEDTPKPMLPVAGVPMLERIMAGVSEHAGITDFVLVVGYLGQSIAGHFGDGSSRGWRVEYVWQDSQLGLGHAMNLAASRIFAPEFLMTYGDILLDPVNYGAATALFRKEQPAAVLGLNWVDDPWSGAAVTVDAGLRVLRIEEKPPRGTSTTHWNNAGLFVFRPDIFDYTSRLRPSARGEYELPDAITVMVSDGRIVRGLPIDGYWRDVGTPDDYAAVNGKDWPVA
ncbi:MAG: NDP-sugar synthase [Capsulimonadaceae bacterium]